MGLPGITVTYREIVLAFAILSIAGLGYLAAYRHKP